MKFVPAFACALFVAGAGLAITGGANAFPNENSNTAGFLPSVTALNQKLKGDAVSITYAYLPHDGRLVIFSGNPKSKGGASELGSVQLTAGDHRNFAVKLSSAPKAGTQLWAAVEQSKADKMFAGSDERAEQSFHVLG